MAPKTIYSRIKDRLSELDRKNAWLARESGVSYDVIRNLNRRPNSTLSAQDAKAISVALQVSTDWLIFGEARVENDNDREGLLERLYDQGSALSTDELRRVVAFIARMKS